MIEIGHAQSVTWCFSTNKYKISVLFLLLIVYQTCQKRTNILHCLMNISQLYFYNVLITTEKNYCDMQNINSQFCNNKKLDKDLCNNRMYNYITTKNFSI